MDVYEPIDRFSPERAEVLARLIEGLPHAPDDEAEAGFNMRRYAHPCGTPSCIAGWASFLLGRGVLDTNATSLTRFLGCTWREAQWLAFGVFCSGKKLVDITPTEAAAAIRAVAEKNFQISGCIWQRGE